ncbi:BTAD domain-containing putative transcriptional regulator [Nocardiopsis mangrovi]|uniref:BTAD domain-containing putative transcriptional regulator n=1 Tax=Nocardiopsis mangrovi TaxID=1179818 RepID=A0ABV9E2F5_9ACTN
MRFGVLGPLEVRTAAGAPVPVPQLKVRALLAALLAAPGRPVPAGRLIDDLWGDDPPRHPGNALQGKVARLRRALADAEPDGGRSVVAQAGGYLLRTGPDDVDASRFAVLTERARATGDVRSRAALLTEALELWRGPAFSDFAEEPFVLSAAARLEQGRLLALEDLAEARLELGEHGQLAAELGALVVGHPHRERLRAVHMRALYRAGRQEEALAGYADLRRHLAEELGADPGADLAALHEAILRQDPDLAAAPARHRTNLPAPVADLIGRDADIAGTRDLLESGRLVTLTGPGGVGKTRLAVETAARLAGAYPDGVWLVELAGIAPADEGQVLCTVAEAVLAILGIRETGPSPSHEGGPRAMADRLAHALRDRRLLLVLDNCEHVVAPVARLAERLLRGAPGLRILATGREPLRLGGELVRAVPPLETPPPDADADPAALRGFAAVRLFLARAADAPGFTLDSGNAAVVAALCRRLDGIPLAVELAASRVRTLGVHGLVARLDDRFGLLVDGYRDAPERQRTLRAVIDWSWDLLTAAERTVLRRLAVHADGCALDAAEAVCAGGGVRPGDVLDLLGRLVDRSLVTLADRASGPRYRLLESVQEYCAERLRDAGELPAVQEGHRDHYIGLAERAGPLLRGPGQRAWLERLDDESANLRRALEHAVHEGAAEPALRLVNALAWYWVLRGRLIEARRSVESALALDGGAPAARAAALAWRAGFTLLEGNGTAGSRHAREVVALYGRTGSPADRAAALWFLGFAQMGLDLEGSERLVDRALADYRALDDPWGTAAALSLRARHALARSDLESARRDGRESARLFGALGDGWGQVQTVFPLATLAVITGDHAEAARRYREGLRLSEELGLWTDAVKQLCGLGRVALLTGDAARARAFHERARDLAREQNFRSGEVNAEIGLGLGDRREGRLDAAESRMRGLLDWYRAVAFGPGGALVLAELGFIAEQRGDAAAARTLHLEGLAAARGLGDPRAEALALEGLAGARALAGHPRHAAVLLGAAAAARASAGAPLPPAERGDVDRITTTARAALGDPAFTAAFTTGTGLAPEAAVAHDAPRSTGPGSSGLPRSPSGSPAGP